MFVVLRGRNEAGAGVLKKGLSCEGVLISTGGLNQVGPAEGPTRHHVHSLNGSRMKVHVHKGVCAMVSLHHV